MPWETLLATAILVSVVLSAGPPPRVGWDARLVLLMLRNLPAVTTSLGLLATPVISTVVASVWLAEAISASLVMAVLLVLGGRDRIDGRHRPSDVAGRGLAAVMVDSRIVCQARRMRRDPKRGGRRMPGGVDR